MKRWNHCVGLQLVKNGDKILRNIRTYSEYKNFALKFFKKFMKLPNMRDGELPQEEESKEVSNQESANKAMSTFAINCLKTAQLLYDLMPLTAALACDIYRDRDGPVKKFCDAYNQM